MTKYLFLSEKPWHDHIYNYLSKRDDESWVRMKRKEDFNEAVLQELQPELIFIPHWSYIIHKAIWENFTCIVFHMTDLPYGRGGSPLQNLIVRGHRETMISAIKVDKGIDTGDIYCKSKLSLEGSAREIFKRSAPIIAEMIERIIEEQLSPSPQLGTPVHFKRRKEEDGRLNQLSTLTEVFNYIRMLDVEGYPSAFVETEHFIIKFKEAKLDAANNSEIHANVVVTKK
jgi:methionyl-tRNA formyltransferase